MDIVGKRNIYFLISGVILIPGFIALFVWGLKFGIDFTGGSRIELSSKNEIQKEKVEEVLKKKNIKEYVININNNKSL